MREGPSVVILGSGLGDVSGSGTPRACEISQGLLLELSGSAALDPLTVTLLDDAALLHRIKYGSERNTARAVLRLFRGRQPAAALEHLTEFLASLPPEELKRGERVRLLISLNLDLHLERCLLKRGVPFTRIVQDSSGSKVWLGEFADVRLSKDTLEIGPRGKHATLPLNDDNAIEAEIKSGSHELLDLTKTPLFLDNRTHPIVYKIFGDIDVPDSCVLSA